MPSPRRAFTLVELLVAISIVILVLAISFPFLGRLRQSTVQTQFRGEVLAAMQSNVGLINTYKSPDADNAAPRISGDIYAGTAVIFDKAARMIRFSNNNQAAADLSVANPNDPAHFLENQTYAWVPPWNPGLPAQTLRKKAYDILKPIEPIQIPPTLDVVGIWRDDNGTPLDPLDDSLKMLPPPFAVCCAPDSYGLPISPRVFADLDGGGTYAPIACAFPAVIVYTRDQVENAGYDPDNLSSLPGANDQEKIDFLLNQCHASLVELTVQNGAAMDTP